MSSLKEENQNQNVKCNWCEWQGNADQLIDEDNNRKEACLNCGRKDAIMDLE